MTQKTKIELTKRVVLTKIQEHVDWIEGLQNELAELREIYLDLERQLELPISESPPA